MFQFFLGLLIYSSFTSMIFGNDEIELPIYVYELKPYIYFDGDDKKKLNGTWLNSFEELAKKSGLKFNYQFTSIPRLEKFLESEAPGCSLTLLKTNKRMSLNGVQFIYDHPAKAIIKSYQRSEDKRELKLVDFQKNLNLKIVTNSSAVTEILKDTGVPAELFFNMNAITNMLFLKRADVFIGSNLTVEKLIEFQEKKIKPGIDIKTLTRGIACSRGTNPDLISLLKKGSNSWVLPE